MTEPPLPPPPSYPPPSSPPPSYPPPPHAPPSYPPFPPPPHPPGEPPVSRRRRLVVLAVAGVTALGLVGAAITISLLADDDVPTDLAAVRSYDQLSTKHLRPGQGEDYPQRPPVGGPHAPVWLDCGVYGEPLPDVNVVHDLEHGTVWITYRPDDLDAADVDRLAKALPDNGILSPYPDQGAPVVVTVWGRQLALAGADDGRLGLFIDRFGAGQTAPEPLASCGGGVAPEDVPRTPDGLGSGGVAAAPAPSRTTTRP